MLKGSSAADDVITPTLALVPLRFIRCSRLGSSALYKLSDVYSGQYTDALTLVASDHPVQLSFSPRGHAPALNIAPTPLRRFIWWQPDTPVP